MRKARKITKGARYHDTARANRRELILNFIEGAYSYTIMDFM